MSMDLFKKGLLFLIIIFFLTANIIPIINGNVTLLKENGKTIVLNSIDPNLNIDYLSKYSAYPGDLVSIYGTGFGNTSGYVVLTGLKIKASYWSDTEIIFTVPENGASGNICIRDSNDIKSNSLSFSVDRILPAGQFEPYGFNLDDTGLLGAAFLVETDGSYFYGVTGFETLCTYEILDNAPYNLCSRIYLPQRVGDIKIFNGYLFLPGDQGLLVYRCSDLQNNNPEVVAAISGGSYLTLDIKEKDGKPIDGALLALCEYIPAWGTNVLHITLYRFDSEELEYLGCYARSVGSTERYHTIAIDPLNPKVYVSGLETLFGNDKYILEIDISDVQNPVLNHREETGGVLAFDMDAKEDTLWTGVVATGTEMFLVYELKPGSNHLNRIQTVQGIFRLGRATRVRIIDDKITVGSSWSGERPDVYILDTFDSGTTPLASENSIDWAFDVTGFSEQSDEYDGKIIIADEWGGFLTYEYTCDPDFSITYDQDYNWVIGGAMTQEIYLNDDRLFVANRGAGVFSADRYDLSDESSWKWVDWEWTETEPQPHPISALCTREDSIHGTLIAALGHNKAMAWGEDIYGILYKETQEDIEFLAISDKIDPPGIYSTGISVIWPEPDLVYMITGTDGFRAYVVNPDEPSIEIHKDCLTQGFGHDSFSTSNIANCMVYYNQKVIIGSSPGLFVNDPTLYIYDVSYPDGVPDRNNPDRQINISKSVDLKCLSFKTVNHIDITSSGLIAVATSQGVAVFHISWIPELNKMSDSKAWELIKIPDDTFLPCWDDRWTSFMADVSFGDDDTIYIVKNPEGVWKIDFTLEWNGYTHNSKPSAFYPGVQCGINYSQLLHGWANPDIVTLHHPYGLIADNDMVYVHGWSGKVNMLSFKDDNFSPSAPNINGPTSGDKGTKYNYTFSSTDPEGGSLYYYINWGDGSIENWIGPYTSGQNIIVGHTWTKQGTYTVKAKVKDTNNGASYWGYLKVKMPRFKIPLQTFLQKLLERFPNTFILFRYLIKI